MGRTTLTQYHKVQGHCKVQRENAPLTSDRNGFILRFGGTGGGYCALGIGGAGWKKTQKLNLTYC